MQTANTSDRRARRSRAEWVKEIRRYRASGQGAAEYAAARGLNAGTLCVWASKLGKGEADQDSERRFLPVRVTRAEDVGGSVVRPGELEVILRNGRRVRIVGDIAQERLAELLAIVEGGGGC